eukprot:1141321-Pelagomonas_calceolata.AAC.6
MLIGRDSTAWNRRVHKAVEKQVFPHPLALMHQSTESKVFKVPRRLEMNTSLKRLAFEHPA